MYIYKIEISRVHKMEHTLENFRLYLKEKVSLEKHIKGDRRELYEKVIDSLTFRGLFDIYKNEPHYKKSAVIAYVNS